MSDTPRTDAVCDYTSPEALHNECKTLERELNAARARIAELEAEAAWRPIESAPRDGTPLLVCDGLNPPHVAQWSTFAECWQWASIIMHPTHWRPLPKPPNNHSRSSVTVSDSKNETNQGNTIERN